MSYRFYSKRGVDVLCCEGDLSTDEMVKMKDRLARLMNRNHRKLLLNLSSARRVELAGLGILVDRLMKVRAQRGDIKLCNMRPEVVETLDRVGVGRLMQSFQTEEEALQSFAA